jgi:hypothetical protein
MHTHEKNFGSHTCCSVDKAHNVLSCARLPGSEKKKGRACAVGSSSSAVSGRFFAFSKFVQEGTAGLTNFEKRGD